MDWLLPLDRHIYFHKMMGWAICFFSVVHTLAHVINYGNVNKLQKLSVFQRSFVSSLPTWIQNNNNNNKKKRRWRTTKKDMFKNLQGHTLKTLKRRHWWHCGFALLFPLPSGNGFCSFLFTKLGERLKNDFHRNLRHFCCYFLLLKNKGIVSRTKGGYMSDYLFDRRVGWIPGMVTPTGLALLFILLIMGLFSHRMVRKSGRFEVNGRSASFNLFMSLLLPTYN